MLMVVAIDYQDDEFVLQQVLGFMLAGVLLLILLLTLLLLLWNFFLAVRQEIRLCKPSVSPKVGHFYGKPNEPSVGADAKARLNQRRTILSQTSLRAAHPQDQGTVSLKEIGPQKHRRVLQAAPGPFGVEDRLFPILGEPPGPRQAVRAEQSRKSSSHEIKPTESQLKEIEPHKNMQ